MLVYIMVNSAKIRKAYDKIAGIYDPILRGCRYHGNIKDILSGVYFRFNGHIRMLDIGCGTGLASEVMRGRFENCEIVGFDYSQNMLARYAQRFPFAKAVVGDFNRSGSLERVGKFDVVISAGAVSEYGEKGKAVKNIYDVLNDNGVFIDIGNRRNAFSLLTGLIWHYWPMGKKRLVKECFDVGFHYVEDLRISWKNMPSKITRYAIRAVK